MNILYLKALHLIFVVTWFAGLFYIVRLFIYHTECQNLPETERKILSEHFKKASRRLWYGITWPSAIGTLIFGTWMLLKIYSHFIPEWLWLKLAFVAGLLLYHIMCGTLFSQLQKDRFRFSGIQLRIWNEIATIFLVAIIFIVVLKGSGNWLNGLLGLLIFSAMLMAGIRIYKKVRESRS